MSRPGDPAGLRYDGQQVQAGRDILGRDLDSFTTSDELLRAGEPGLRFFEIFTPLYSRYTHSIVDYRSEIAKPYRNLRGIDLAAFRHDAARFAGASAGLEESRHVLASGFRDLGSHWRGDAAEQAGNHVDRFLEQAGGVERFVGAFGRTAGRLGAAIAEQVRSRARVALELYSPECGGLPYPTVEDLVDIATGSVGARQILDTQFVPEFEERLAQFREVALAAAEDGIRRLWEDFS
ncbi:MAG: WXG100 family type VII secretion target, partial [Pseudonocardiaceae bacterium]